MIEIPKIETARLVMREFRNDDFESYFAVHSDPEVMRYLSGSPLTRGEAWRHLAMIVGHWHLRGYGFWAVEEKFSGELVGRVGVWQPETWPGFEIGWTIARSRWGTGYAPEAARAALDWTRRNLPFRHVISLIHPENRASIRVAEKLGESLEGETQVLGRDVLVYGMDL